MNNLLHLSWNNYLKHFCDIRLPNGHIQYPLANWLLASSPNGIDQQMETALRKTEINELIIWSKISLFLFPSHIY
jgi:hypothetical protein